MKNFFTNIWVHIVFVFVLGFFIFGRTQGFCANSLSIAPSAVPTFEAFSQGMASGGFAWGDPVIMTTEALNNINMNLYQLYGYDLNDLVDDSWNALTTPSEWSNRLTQFVTGNATIDGTTIDTSIADKIAQRISQGALTGAVTARNLLDSGYAFFSTAVPQWGENAKQFFIGKRDALTNEIVDVSPTMVTKITAQGLMAYNDVYNSLVNNNSIKHLDSVSPVFTKSFCTYGVLSSSKPNSVLYSSFSFSQPVIIFSDTTTTYGVYRLFLLVPTSYGSFDEFGAFVLNDIFLSGSYIDGYGSAVDVSSVSLAFTNTLTINGIEYVYGKLFFNSGVYPGTTYRFGDLNDSISLVGQNSSDTISYGFSSSALSVALKDQLDRLIGKYVDSITLGRINDIVQSIPIGQELVGEADVPVAIPTQEVVDELTAVIDEALELDEAYALAFDDAYAEPIDTTADPSPDFPQFPSGVPEDYVPPFLTDLFPTDMFSMFEPIFDIVGDQYSMFDTWLLIPAIFIFLFIFYVIISVL